MADLHADAGVAVAVHEVHDAGESARLLVIPQAGASRGDARVGRNAGHLHHHQAGAAHGAAAQMHQVEIARHAVLAGYMAMGETMMRFLSRTPRA